MYELTEETKMSIKQKIENTLGINYEEYEQLDFDEQQAIITEYHKKNKNKKSKKVIVMVGSGKSSIFKKIQKGEITIIGTEEHSTFVRVGITPNELKHELDDKIDEIVYNKPVAFIKKIQRRINK